MLSRNASDSCRCCHGRLSTDHSKSMSMQCVYVTRRGYGLDIKYQIQLIIDQSPSRVRCPSIHLGEGQRIGLVFIYNRTEYVSQRRWLYLQSVISILAPVGAIHSCLHSWQPTGPWQCRSYMGIPPRVTELPAPLTSSLLQLVSDQSKYSSLLHPLLSKIKTRGDGFVTVPVSRTG